MASPVPAPAPVMVKDDLGEHDRVQIVGKRKRSPSPENFTPNGVSITLQSDTAALNFFNELLSDMLDVLTS